MNLILIIKQRSAIFLVCNNTPQVFYSLYGYLQHHIEFFDSYSLQTVNINNREISSSMFIPLYMHHFSSRRKIDISLIGLLFLLCRFFFNAIFLFRFFFRIRK